MSYKFNPFTGNFDLVGASGTTTWKDPVNTTADLPVSPTEGEARVVKSTDQIYVYDLTSAKWIDTGINIGSFSNTSTANGISYDSNVSGNVNTPTISLHAASNTNPGAVSTGTQTFAGTKTFSNDVTVSGIVYTNTVDTTETGASDTLAIGITNADFINIGRSGVTINVMGDTFYENVTNLDVADKNISVNVGGSAGSGSASGISVSENSIITGYAQTSADRASWTLKPPAVAGIATISPGAGGITLNQSSHDPVTLTAVGAAPNANGASLSSQALTLQPADATHPGVLTAADWNTFNNKQPAGNYITALTGDVTATGPGSVAATIANSAVTNAKLANMANNTVKANKSGISAAPSDLALSDVTETGSSVLTISNGSKSVVSASNLTIQVSQSTTSTSGYLSSTDWNTFNNKQDIGTYVTDPTAPTAGQGLSEKDSGGTARFILGYADGTKFSAFDGLPADTALLKGDIVGSPTSVMSCPPSAASTTDSSSFATLSTGSVVNTSSTGVSGAAQVYSGGNYGLGASGNGLLQSGDVLNASSSANTGTVNVRSGASSGTGATGLVNVSSGNKTNVGAGNSGLVRVRSGTTAGTGNSGSATLSSGNATGSTGSSGSVNLTSGNSTNGNSGSIAITTGTAGVSRGDISLNASNINLISSGGIIDCNTAELRNVVDPTTAQSAATKNYVDTNFLSKTLTNAHIFVGNGSNVATDVAMSGDISISNTGATAYAGTVPINKGGTGQTTASAAFNALSPMTTLGDVIIGGTSGAGTRLGIGSTGQVLTVVGGSPAWAASPSATGDIFLTSFSAANNQSSAANVTGLSFSTSTIRSFEALLSVSVVATSSLFESYSLRGIYNGTSWNMVQESNGDVSQFTFTITNAGQVQYTSANYSGFSSATVKFRAIVTTQ